MWLIFIGLDYRWDPRDDRPLWCMVLVWLFFVLVLVLVLVLDRTIVSFHPGQRAARAEIW
jgi:hypothetical protein